MLQYYTLDEAVKLLGTTPEEGKKLLDEHKIKQFRDGRGKVRYVASAVDLLARSLGRGSEPELQMGEAPPVKSGNSPRPKKAEPEVFDFQLGGDEGDVVEVGRTPRPKAGDSRKGGPKSPPPKVGSDSDVRLVADGSDLDFKLGADSDVRMVDDGGPISSKSGVNLGKAPKKGQPGAGDSGARLVSMELPPDSDVRMVDEEGSGESSGVNLGAQPAKKHSDSDIRLEQQPAAAKGGGGTQDSHITEEIDLDAEQRKAEQAARAKGGKKRSTKAKAPLPTQSPFELSDADVPAAADSSDFELKPGGESGSLELSSGDLTAMRPPSGDEVDIGDLAPAAAGSSGINLKSPADSGISLEGGGDSEEVEFELSLDAVAATPKPARAKPASPSPEEDSDSEFELSLESDSSADQPALGSSPVEGDSDSEFELTLDDSGGLQPLAADPATSGEGDIFETDFEVPALEADSGSEAVALDDADSDSEFDLALEEGDMASDEESGSQVVALEDEGEVDDAAETVHPRNRRRGAAALAGSEVGEMLDSDEEGEPLGDDEAAPGRRLVGAGAAPAEWGVLPALVMLPCVVVMLLAGMMGYELVRGMWGYQQSGKVSGFLTDGLARQFGAELPKE